MQTELGRGCKFRRINLNTQVKDGMVSFLQLIYREVLDKNFQVAFFPASRDEKDFAAVVFLTVENILFSFLCSLPSIHRLSLQSFE